MAAAIFHGSNINDATGNPVQFIGDIHNQGTETTPYGSIAIGSPADSSTSEDGGAVYLMMSIGK